MRRSSFSAAKEVVARIKRKDGDAGGERGKDLAALQTGSFAGAAVGKELKLQAVMRTFADAIQAEQAFGFTPRHAADWIVATLAMQEAAIAIIAGCGILLKSENGPARNETRAERPTGKGHGRKNA